MTNSSLPRPLPGRSLAILYWLSEDRPQDVSLLSILTRFPATTIRRDLVRLECNCFVTRCAGQPQTFLRKRYGSVVLEKDVGALLGKEAVADPMISGWRHA